MALIDIDAAYRLVEMEDRQAAGGGVPADKPQGLDVVLAQQEQVPVGPQKIFGDRDRVRRRGGAERFDRIGKRLRQPEGIDGDPEARAARGLGRRAVCLQLRLALPDKILILPSLAVRRRCGRTRLLDLPDIEITRQPLLDSPLGNGLPAAVCRGLRRGRQASEEQTKRPKERWFHGAQPSGRSAGCLVPDGERLSAFAAAYGYARRIKAATLSVSSLLVGQDTPLFKLQSQAVLLLSTGPDIQGESRIFAAWTESPRTSPTTAARE